MRQPKRSRVLSAALFILFASAPVGAQEANPLVRERIVIQSQGNSPSGSVESRGQQVRVQSSLNVFMPVRPARAKQAISCATVRAR